MVALDDGGEYRQSGIQAKMWERWAEFGSRWVPEFTHRERFALVVNGDAIDGVHHNSVTQISHNVEDQLAIAEACLAPLVKRASAYYHIRGTEAHVGKSAQYEEALARRLGAVPNDEGQFSRWQLYMRVGNNLVHFAHHISASTSPFAKSSALQREIVRGNIQAARWGLEAPALYVRGHRHVYSTVEESRESGRSRCVVVPGWQAMTPYGYRLALAVEQPEFGGIVIRAGDVLYTREKVWTIDRPREVVI